MELTRLKSNLKVISIVAAGSVSLPSFAYSDIDKYSNIMSVSNNSQFVNYLKKNSDAAFTNQFTVESLFNYHYKKWQSKTKFLSSSYAIVNNEDFKSIVRLGESAVPYIIKSIKEKPSTLVWALNYIYDKKISTRRNLTITDACKLWTKMIEKNL